MGVLLGCGGHASVGVGLVVLLLSARRVCACMYTCMFEEVRREFGNWFSQLVIKLLCNSAPLFPFPLLSFLRQGLTVKSD